MARKKKAAGTKTASILNFQAKNPGASAKQVVAGLAEQGVDVTEGLVYNVRSRSGMGKKSARKKPAKKVVAMKERRAGRKKATRKKLKRPNVSALTAKDLFEAKKLVDKLGSLDGARQAIAALEQLR